MDREPGQPARRRPTLQQLVDLSQIVGALGVIVSVLYLAAEVRQNTRAVRAGTFQTLTELSVALRTFPAQDPASAQLWLKAVAHPDSLDPVEQIRWSAYVGAVYRQFENVHYQYRTGMLDEELWPGYDHMFRVYSARPGYGRWYRAHAQAFSRPFRAYMADVLRSPSAQEPIFAPAGERR